MIISKTCKLCQLPADDNAMWNVTHNEKGQIVIEKTCSKCSLNQPMLFPNLPRVKGIETGIAWTITDEEDK